MLSRRGKPASTAQAIRPRWSLRRAPLAGASTFPVETWAAATPPPLENGSPNGQWVGVGPSDDNDDAGGDQRALMVSTNSPRRTLSCSDRWARGGLPQLLSVAAML